MEDKFYRLLREFGLGNNESVIFKYLVGKDKLTAYTIAKDTKIHRSTCYDVLERLDKKGFVVKSNKEGKKYYSANEIDKILGRLKNKESILMSTIPEIKKIEFSEKTNVNFSNSKNTFSEFNMKLFNMAKNEKLSFVYMISNSPDLTTFSSKIFIKQLMNSVKKLNLDKVDARAIWDKKYKKSKFMNQFAKFGENRFLETLPNASSTFIYDGYVSYVFLNEGENVIEIKSTHVSDEMKAYFEYLWKQAKK